MSKVSSTVPTYEKMSFTDPANASAALKKMTTDYPKLVAKLSDSGTKVFYQKSTLSMGYAGEIASQFGANA